jgi:dual specificity protein kinase YAK1
LILFRYGSIVHGDLKPENILLVSEESTHVKVVDFGAARCLGERYASYIQSRYYRAPEVVLRLPHAAEIDMWSVGCILCELFLGVPLFAGQNEIQLLEIIADFLGPIPLDMAQASPKFGEYFFPDGKMKTTAQVCQEKGIPPPQRYHYHHTETSLLDLVVGITKRQIKRPVLEQSLKRCAEQRTVFVDLLLGMLAYRPQERITPDDALQHPFLVADLSI